MLSLLQGNAFNKVSPSITFFRLHFLLTFFLLLGGPDPRLDQSEPKEPQPDFTPGIPDPFQQGGNVEEPMEIDDKFFKYDVKKPTFTRNKRFKETSFHHKINLKINLNAKYDVQHYEQEIDEMYSKIMNDVRAANKLNDDCLYYVNVTNHQDKTRFHMGGTPIGQFDGGQLFRMLHKISQSATDFINRQFTLSVTICNSGSGSGHERKRSNKAPEELANEKRKTSIVSIKNKGN